MIAIFVINTFHRGMCKKVVLCTHVTLIIMEVKRIKKRLLIQEMVETMAMHGLQIGLGHQESLL